MTEVEANKKQELNQKISSLINDNHIVLFMKGKRNLARCGFSERVMKIVDLYTTDYEIYDVTSDYDLKEQLKEYSNWPTFPQLYIKGELIGGCDIVTEMDRKDELRALIES